MKPASLGRALERRRPLRRAETDRGRFLVVSEAKPDVVEVESGAAGAEPEVQRSHREPLPATAGDGFSAKSRPSFSPRIHDPLS